MRLYNNMKWYKHLFMLVSDKRTNGSKIINIFFKGDCGVGERVVKEKDDQKEGPASKKRER